MAYSTNPNRKTGLNRTDLMDETLSEALKNNELLAESYNSAVGTLLAMRADDEGWTAINSLTGEDAFSLKNIQDISRQAELQTTGNPLLKRGLSLRTSNVFGRGIKFEGVVQPRFKSVLDKPAVQHALFTQKAFTENERAAFTTGNLIMAYDKKEKTFYPIPFEEITGFASNPRQVSDVWYYQRTYSEIDPTTGVEKTEATVEWYPVLEKSEAGTLRTSIKGEDSEAKPVISTIIIIDAKFNTRIGAVWGVPDCLPAMPYAWAHAEYLRDGSKVLKALATIAWKVVAKSRAGSQNTAAKMANNKGAGSTAAFTEGTDLVSMPKAGQVNLRDGQALAGYVASSLEVSLIALLSDPGTASGSYGAAASLDGPSAASARSRQEFWASFYRRCYRAVGIKDIVVNFPKLTEDPVFRQAQTLQIGRAMGAIWSDEARVAFLEANDITPLHTDPPPLEEYVQAANALGALNAAAAATQAADAQAAGDTPSDPTSRQGNSTPAGSLSSGDNSTRDQAATPGTGGA